MCLYLCLYLCLCVCVCPGRAGMDGGGGNGRLWRYITNSTVGPGTGQGYWVTMKVSRNDNVLSVVRFQHAIKAQVCILKLIYLFIYKLLCCVCIYHSLRLLFNPPCCNIRNSTHALHCLCTEERESALMSLIIEVLLKSLYQSREPLNSQFKAHISFKRLIILAMLLFSWAND